MGYQFYFPKLPAISIHRLIREILHANSVIPLRSWNADFVGGTYRQEMTTRFNDIIYPRRQLVENKFSVLKRKFSGDLKARKFLIQTKEIARKMIVRNLHRFLQFLIVEVFYSAHFSAHFKHLRSTIATRLLFIRITQAKGHRAVQAVVLIKNKPMQPDQE